MTDADPVAARLVRGAVAEQERDVDGPALPRSFPPPEACHNRCVLILLPPSEGKSAPARGRPLDLGSLSHPELTEARSRLLDELAEISRRPDACEILDAPASAAPLVRDQAHLREAPAARASAVYSGVLYEALDASSLDASSRRRMAKRVLVFSALFGVLRMTDRVPAYRLSAGVRLPDAGGVQAFWRPRLEAVLQPRGLVVDCRSASYAAMWRPPAETHVPVRVLREKDGRRTVVSHMAKHTRGLVARALCEQAAEPRTTGELATWLGEWFEHQEVRTATGEPVRYRVEPAGRGLDVVTF